MDRSVYRLGRLTLTSGRQLMHGDTPVAIARKPLRLLSALACANGDLVTKDELMAAVWPDTVVEENAVQVHVAAVRKVLGEDAGLLTTVHGLGYRLRTCAADLGAEAPSGPPRRDGDLRICFCPSCGLHLPTWMARNLAAES